MIKTPQAQFFTRSRPVHFPCGSAWVDSVLWTGYVVGPVHAHSEFQRTNPRHTRLRQKLEPCASMVRFQQTGQTRARARGVLRKRTDRAPQGAAARVRFVRLLAGPAGAALRPPLRTYGVRSCPRRPARHVRSRSTFPTEPPAARSAVRSVPIGSAFQFHPARMNRTRSICPTTHSRHSPGERAVRRARLHVPAAVPRSSSASWSRYSARGPVPSGWPRQAPRNKALQTNEPSRARPQSKRLTTRRRIGRKLTRNPNRR